MRNFYVVLDEQGKVIEKTFSKNMADAKSKAVGFMILNHSVCTTWQNLRDSGFRLAKLVEIK